MANVDYRFRMYWMELEERVTSIGGNLEVTRDIKRRGIQEVLLRARRQIGF